VGTGAVNLQKKDVKKHKRGHFKHLCERNDSLAIIHSTCC